MRSTRALALVVPVLLAAVVLWLTLGQRGGDTDPVAAGADTRPWDDIDACADSVLPQELEPVVQDIEAGGPFDYPDRDGSTFGNYEDILPRESRDYYSEFTVETPGLSHRGAKRVVTGGGQADPEVWYYTDDHYESFCEFIPGE